MLERISFFEGVSQDLLDEIEQKAEEKVFVAGSMIIKEGDMGEAMYLILSGSVSVFRSGSEVASLGRDDFFGETALVMSAPRNATVIANEDTQVLVITQNIFQEIFGHDPVLTKKIGEAITTRLSDNDKNDLTSNR